MSVTEDIILERARQIAKFGQQNHPDIDPGIVPATPAKIAEALGLPSEAEAKARCDAHTRQGRLNWGVILVEEVCEAAAAIGDDAALEKELIQVAAVAVAWVECIRRRRPRTDTTSQMTLPLPPRG